jgi:large subunit ribosomal protein L9
MEIILLQKIEKLGEEGATVKVKDGFATNYLIPRKMAMPFSPGVVKVIEARKKKTRIKAEKEKGQAQELAKRIAELSLTVTAESGVNDTLFGSITSETIMHALQQEGVQIDKKDIVISEPIKKLGIYTVEVKLHPEVKENLRLWVVKK